MAEINNSLALGIKADPIDIMKPLMGAAQINSLRAGTAQTEQETQYRQFQQDQGLGYRVNDLNILADTHQKQMDIGGRIGSILEKDQSLAARKQAIQLSHSAGRPVDPEVEQHILSAPASQVKQYGLNMQRGGQSAPSNMETSGDVTRNQGQYLPESLQSNVPYNNRTAVATGTAGGPTQAKVDNAIKTGRNFDGSPRVTSTADITGTDMFTPSIVRGQDGSVSSSVTPATTALQGQAIEQYKKAGEVASTAQNLTMRLDMMDHSADILNSAGWSSTGTGANAKLGAAKSVNSLLQSVGLPAAIDPTKIANWEDLNKETKRAGFDLSKTLGSREAASIVESATSAVPGAENSPLGFKLVSSGIRQAVQREKDFYNFATDYAKSHRGNTFGADVEFNNQYPPELYSKTAVANSIDPRAIGVLKRDTQKGDKSAATEFDQKYGSGMSAFIFQHDQPK